MKNTLVIENNVWAKMSGPRVPDVVGLLRFKPKGYQFAPAYKAFDEARRRGDRNPRGWDGWIKLTRQTDDAIRVPAGLVPLVMQQPWAQDIELDDRRVQPPDTGGDLYATRPLVTLDPHQLSAVEAAVQAEQGLIVYPTGTGKGRIIGEIIRRLNVQTLVICDKLDLVTQLRREISQATGHTVGTIGGGKFSLDDIVVSTYQSLTRILEDDGRAPEAAALTGYGCVIVDEGHHAEAKTMSEVLQHIPAYYRLGFSATAFKSYKGQAEDKGTFLRVQAFLGPVIASMSIAEGVATERIVPPDIYIVHGCTPDPLLKPINYSEEYQANIVNNEARNFIVTSLARKLQPTVVLVQRIEHGELLARYLKGYAGGVPFVSGQTPVAERQVHYEAFKRGDIPCLIIGKIGDEALDLPNIGALILAGGGNAPHVQIQRIGRGMRASEGKERVMVFDFEDYGKYLPAHYKRRVRTYNGEVAYSVIDVDALELGSNP